MPLQKAGICKYEPLPKYRCQSGGIAGLHVTDLAKKLKKKQLVSYLLAAIECTGHCPGVHIHSGKDALKGGPWFSQFVSRQEKAKRKKNTDYNCITIPANIPVFLCFSCISKSPRTSPRFVVSTGKILILHSTFY